MHDYSLIWLIPFFPLVGFIVNGLLGKKIGNEKVIGAIGTLAIAASFVVSCKMFFQLLGDVEKTHEVILFSWMSVGQLQIDWGFLLDPLSALMIMVVTGVGSLIHLYSNGYMHGEEGFYRYFAYLNLFCFSMLMLVLGNNALVMFVGWEGVGLCSYLLIGYYFEKKSAGDAAKKAFVVNRVGDFGFLIGLFTLFWALGEHGVWTFQFTKIAENAHLLPAGGVVVTVATLCFFLGATGKSAQIPLYTWLPDAMEGPTPVSALIHAATMVTAGVYMIGRMNGLFSMAPDTMMVIAIVGAATAIFAASIGLAQNDIKRVLAYSTVSQLGYMFLAMGVGAFSAGIFHLMTHAFFKACLFLGSGSVIHAMHHAYHKAHLHDDPQDMRNMGGLAKKMPITFITFFISTLAISGIPGLSGFFSKDEILWWAFSSTRGGWILWLIGFIAAGMTAFYMFRLVFMTFFGKQKTDARAKDHVHESPLVITIPLMVLGLLALVGGWVGIPAALGGANRFEHFLAPVFEHAQETYGIHSQHSLHAFEFPLMGCSIGIALVGIFLAWIMYVKNPELPGRLVARFRWLHTAIFNKWFVDELYDGLFVNATKRLGRYFWKGFDVPVIDGIVNGVGWLVQGSSRVLRFIQNGQIHSYAMTMVLGMVVIVAVYVFK
ncbi:NADH-quinone oxidoreductase subunit L [Geothermobacter hydrogeniphilus]|uniref:NADH-quinone oxidoreductase subunit L n=1 Tax=Geothermobacter hydrogeniphilus TaxID=1969733 RepID=A0A2K2HBM6_9BACT|nr:NADH-quinone oxidoreductase subunit L [Geothermobacter hydrogeniphilus]PNU20667.1 NADH-quinone oxidoreductase subunit L [Geothermobacter hydrogeniphilus]